MSGGRTGIDPFFYGVIAFAAVVSLVCLGLAWWMP